ncbi:PID-CTERM protein-sorting domain-containing protein [Pontibacter chinhatensis]|uniref:PID-CTERM protein-sorting domain-containing protein n=1 Tax=Pontibacter chinhatensis TaxID=1436961 RepID=UPI000B833C7B|nr:hypothetical protein [Pontibacter chinhatensis]
MKTLIIRSLLILPLFAWCFSSDLNAQGRSQDRPGRSGEAPGRNKGATGVPIDGASGVLLAAGAAYGLKKLRDFRKQKNNPE